LKAASRTAGAGVIAPELFMEFFVPVHDAESALYVRLGREALPALTGDLEKTGCLDRRIDLSYGLRG